MKGSKDLIILSFSDSNGAERYRVIKYYLGYLDPGILEFLNPYSYGFKK